ncbi:MAG TPA: hypothetical protein VG013_07935 [Gemmataceae bacterium]|nr:hypothetical protein [Gemmataceae bacterium]
MPAGAGFIYGVSPSPDGKRICYHRNYRLYLAEGDGRNARPVKDAGGRRLPQRDPGHRQGGDGRGERSDVHT